MFTQVKNQLIKKLLDPTNRIRLRDPINTPGDWNSSSFQPKSVLTQSTRASSIFGDGAGGGLDDRFDFVLLSSDMFQPWNTIVYEEEFLLRNGQYRHLLQPEHHRL